MVPYDVLEKSICGGESNWKRGRLAKNVGQRKIKKHHVAGICNHSTRANSQSSQ